MAVAPGSPNRWPHSRVSELPPLSEIERAPGLSTVTWKVTAAPVCAVQNTGVVPTGKNDPDGGLQVIAGMVSPFSPVLVVPQKPVPVGVVEVTTAPACPASALTVILSGVESWQGAFVTFTSVVTLLFSATGSDVVVVTLAAFEMEVPVATVPTR